MLSLIEKYKETDREDLQKLFLKVKSETFTWVDTSKMKLTSFDFETQGEVILVAHEDQKIAGFISFWIPDNFIHHLYVDKKYQNKGIGTQLLKAALPFLSSPVRLKCLKQNKLAIHFYEKRQFVVKGEGVSFDGEYFLFEYRF